MQRLSRKWRIIIDVAVILACLVALYVMYKWVFPIPYSNFTGTE